MGEFKAEDGTTRKDYYGAGRQPWDDIIDAGWGAAFAAGNVLKYVRRTKGNPDDLEKARWYYARIIERYSMKDPNNLRWAEYGCALMDLNNLLSAEEREKLR